MRYNDIILPDDTHLGRNSTSWVKFIFTFVGSIFFYLSIFIVLIVIPPINDKIGIIVSYIGAEAGTIFTSLLMIGFFHFALALAIYLFYRRKYLSLFTYHTQKIPRLWQIFAFFLIVIAFSFLASLLLGPLLVPSPIHLIWNKALWLRAFIPMAIVIFLQSSAEEALFRGFLQQYFHKLTKNRGLAIVVPTAFWAILHFWNIESPIIGAGIVFYIFVLGLIFGDLAMRHQSLKAPVWIHFFNNLFVLMFFGSTLTPNTLSIYEIDYTGIADGQILFEMSVSALVLGGIYMIVRRRWI